MSNQVLITAFHFPPQAGGSGIQRTVNFVRYLPESGWQPVVLSAHLRAYEEHSYDLMDKIPEGTTVIRGFALDAARHFGVARKYPRFMALPDRWSSWWFGGVLAGRRAISHGHIRALWSTQPIPTAHLIGYSLAAWSGLPWVADFRDPIINANPPTDPLLRRFWQWVEARTVRKATRCVFTTERTADLYAKRYPEHSTKFLVISNGYDEAVFNEARPDRFGVPKDHVFLLHSGQIYPSDRDPSGFFQAVRAQIDAGAIDRYRLRIRFRASGSDDFVRGLANSHGLSDIVEMAPPLSYEKSIDEVLGADLLLLIQGSRFNAQIPAKTYEYLRAGRPVLALLDVAGETAGFLRNFSSPRCCEIDNPDAIGEGILEMFSKLQDPGFKGLIEDDQRAIRKFSRREQTQVLAKLLDEVSTSCGKEKI